MAGTTEHLSVREALLVLLDAAGGELIGRTVVQKMAYFSGVVIGEQLGHRAHYYGPYSRDVELALTDSAFSGDVKETVERFPDWYGHGPDMRKYTYELSDQGKDLVKDLREQNPDLCQRIDAAVAKLDELADRNQHTLSMAAKADLILGQQEGPIVVGEIKPLAEDLGWKMSDEDVVNAIKVLEGFGRVKTDS